MKFYFLKIHSCLVKFNCQREGALVISEFIANFINSAKIEFINSFDKVVN
jgi:hypothetical protein